MGYMTYQHIESVHISEMQRLAPQDSSSSHLQNSANSLRKKLLDLLNSLALNNTQIQSLAQVFRSKISYFFEVLNFSSFHPNHTTLPKVFFICLTHKRGPLPLPNPNSHFDQRSDVTNDPHAKRLQTLVPSLKISFLSGILISLVHLASTEICHL